MPFDFFTSIFKSSLLLLKIFSAFEVIKYSARSISFNISNLFLSTVTFKVASKLEPISLLALFSSIAIFAFSFITKSFVHLSSRALFCHSFGILEKYVHE